MSVNDKYLVGGTFIKLMEIDKIVDSTHDENGIAFYKVKWKNNWIDEKSLLEKFQNASLLIHEFCISKGNDQCEHSAHDDDSVEGDSRDLYENYRPSEDDVLSQSNTLNSPTNIITNQTTIQEELSIEKYNGEESEEEEEIEGTVFMCDICNETFTTHKSLSNHKADCSSKVNKAEYCTTDDSEGILYIPLTSASTKLHQCTQCFAVFDTEIELNKHTTKHSDKNLVFECENCHMTFADEEYLTRHMVRCKNHTYSNYKCEICQRGFTTKGSLELHVDAVHLKKKEFGCSLCGKLFSRKHILKVHLATHYGKRDFICSTCGKTFLQKGNLNRHERIHQAKNFGYKCRHCGQAFTQNKHLQRHLATQHNEI